MAELSVAGALSDHEAAEDCLAGGEMARVEQIGDCTLYLGDCREVLPTLGKVDAVVTDPPYGIKRDKGFQGFQGFGGFGTPIPRTQYEGDWDSIRPEKSFFDLMLDVGERVIIFGGNFFTDFLPVGNHWIVWNKLNTMPTFGDCELAWTNIKRNSVKKYTVEYNGLLGKEDKRFHATQKPVKIMSLILRDYTEASQTILDPFMGSGTTLVACAKLGRKGIGIEIERKYFDIACKRVEEAYKQGDFFIEKPRAIKQDSML